MNHITMYRLEEVEIVVNSKNISHDNTPAGSSALSEKGAWHFGLGKNFPADTRLYWVLVKVLKLHPEI